MLPQGLLNAQKWDIVDKKRLFSRIRGGNTYEQKKEETKNKEKK